ncbi:hypothetical protein DUNSADRAFT_3901 [Dunaliella salina]|uniref:Encoded protein n=1 Tax=Dunaliella salina TaxID=3046 RepID=A0ABQ7GT18_DUNSA|nr:hypothetical protein DUNSADRAFT_3901 [Dunaliella salina]|eukprot:KAF5837758.1 hypothetical protein DUNSADRAFT_3901 [Dunaliella salina]
MHVLCTLLNSCVPVSHPLWLLATRLARIPPMCASRILSRIIHPAHACALYTAEFLRARSPSTVAPSHVCGLHPTMCRACTLSRIIRPALFIQGPSLLVITHVPASHPPTMHPSTFPILIPL